MEPMPQPPSPYGYAVPKATPPTQAPKWPWKGGALRRQEQGVSPAILSELPDGVSGVSVPERPVWGPGEGGGETPALGTTAGAGVFPLLPNQDVQRVILLQVEDAQHRHAVGPHHGVLPTFSASRPIAGDAATGQITRAPIMGCEDQLPFLPTPWLPAGKAHCPRAGGLSPASAHEVKAGGSSVYCQGRGLSSSERDRKSRHSQS